MKRFLIVTVTLLAMLTLVGGCDGSDPFQPRKPVPHAKVAKPDRPDTEADAQDNGNGEPGTVTIIRLPKPADDKIHVRKDGTMDLPANTHIKYTNEESEQDNERTDDAHGAGTKVKSPGDYSGQIKDAPAATIGGYSTTQGSGAGDSAEAPSSSSIVASMPKPASNAALYFFGGFAIVFLVLAGVCIYGTIYEGAALFGVCSLICFIAVFWPPIFIAVFVIVVGAAGYFAYQKWFHKTDATKAKAQVATATAAASDAQDQVTTAQAATDAAQAKADAATSVAKAAASAIATNAATGIDPVSIIKNMGNDLHQDWIDVVGTPIGSHVPVPAPRVAAPAVPTPPLAQTQPR